MDGEDSRKSVEKRNLFEIVEIDGFRVVKVNREECAKYNRLSTLAKEKYKATYPEQFQEAENAVPEDLLKYGIGREDCYPVEELARAFEPFLSASIAKSGRGSLLDRAVNAYRQGKFPGILDGDPKVLCANPINWMLWLDKEFGGIGNSRVEYLLARCLDLGEFKDPRKASPSLPRGYALNPGFSFTPFRHAALMQITRQEEAVGTLPSEAAQQARISPIPSEQQRESRNLFREDSTTWQIAFNGKEICIPKSRGAELLHALIEQQGIEISALTLVPEPTETPMPTADAKALKPYHGALRAYP